MRYLDRLIAPDDTPLAWLTAALSDAEQFHAHIGYLDRAGIRLVEQPLRDLLERGGQAHIVVDYRDGLPRYGDIAWLVDLLAPYGERATLRLVRDLVPLHAKVFSIRTADGDRRALVGSANFTAAGLGRNWEACIAVDPGDTDALDSIDAAAAAWTAHPAGMAVDTGTLNALAALDKTDPAGRSERLMDAAEPVLNRLEAGVDNPGEPVGLPTGFEELDKLHVSRAGPTTG